MKRAWRELCSFTQDIWKAYDQRGDDHIKRAVSEIDLPGGSEIWMRTAERPDSLAGEGVKGAVVDEFSLMKEEVWTEYLEATLLDYNGWAMFIGVPKGMNWAGALYKNCETRKGWRGWNFPTSSNPAIDKERLEDIRENIPELLFSQEYLAQIVDGAGVVFKNILACVTAEQIEKAIEGRLYVFGLDWGKSRDFTVVTVLDVKAKKEVFKARFNDTDYPTQLEKVRALYQLFKPRSIVAESNAMGEPLCDQLRRDGLPIRKFFTTNKSKREIIEDLMVAFEQETISILDHPETKEELEAYECKITPNGAVTYNAPKGKHDDCVMSLALAWNDVAKGSGISL
jgi:hypothetical protein